MTSLSISAEPIKTTQVPHDTVQIVSTIDGNPAGMPLVSAVIPAYNAGQFIHRSIESALAQTHHLVEVIVVDDGSTDDTAAVAAQYPVTVIRQTNGGPAKARNTGVKAARGEWIAFLDHDDLWHIDKTEKQLQYAKPGVSAIFCRKDVQPHSTSFDEMWDKNYGGNPSSTLIRRDVLLELGLFDEERALMGVDDYNLWLRFTLKGYQFVTTPNHYEFTPDQDHYGGNPEKMLAAELLNLDKIAATAKIDPSRLEQRKRALRLEYLPDLISARKLGSARQQLRWLGFNRETARYWTAFLPGWVLDARRQLRKSLWNSPHS
jgi:glycosyltransferase involved in cell wall biosynthesis